MGKGKGFFILVLLAVAAFLIYKFDIDIKKGQNRQVANQNIVEEQYQEAELKVDDAAIIKKALKAVGVLAVLEGEEEYRQIIEEENWYSYRGISIDWRYKFAIAMNLEDIGIIADNGTINVTIDKEKLFIQFIEKTKDSTSRSDASLLAKKFSSQEIEALEKAVLVKIEEKIKLMPSYWDEALKSLEVSIRKICSDLEYYDINFIK
jgi:hypothetical protein